MSTLFTFGNLDIRVLDILDIIIAAYLIYFIYKYVKGTAAVNIFVGIVLFLLLLIGVTQLKMRLLTLMLGSIAGIGLIGLIVIFQPEIRRVLLMIGNNTVKGRFNFLESFFKFTGIKNKAFIDRVCGNVIEAIEHLSQTKTGAILVFTKSDLPSLVNTGFFIDSELNSILLEAIFYKNAPLHDGAVIIQNNRIVAASCILPVSSSNEIPKEMGLRHRAALGVAENNEVLVVIVSEENGGISYATDRKLYYNVSKEEFKIRLEKYYMS